MANSKFTQGDLNSAITRMKLLKFFPGDPGARGALMELLATLCPHREALLWLTDTLINRVGEWPGPTELRGLLCTHYRPADGVEAYCGLPGWTARDMEQREIDRNDSHKALESGPQQVLRDRLAEVAPKLLEARKL